MHRMIFTDDDRELIESLCAQLRQEPPAESADSVKLMTTARDLLGSLGRSGSQDAPEMESPELLTVLHALLGPLLQHPLPSRPPDGVNGVAFAGATPENANLADSTDHIAQLAVALYLAHELINELQPHHEH